MLDRTPQSVVTCDRLRRKRSIADVRSQYRLASSILQDSATMLTTNTSNRNFRNNLTYSNTKTVEPQKLMKASDKVMSSPRILRRPLSNHSSPEKLSSRIKTIPQMKSDWSKPSLREHKDRPDKYERQK